jgi:hypothetical protein
MPDKSIHTASIGRVIGRSGHLYAQCPSGMLLIDTVSGTLNGNAPIERHKDRRSDWKTNGSRATRRLLELTAM